jgi:hypothetical protein
MKRISKLLIATLFFSSLVVAQTNETKTIYFESGSHSLPERWKSEIIELFNPVSKEKLKSITVIGYSDTVGNISSNLALSKKRALEVSKCITNLGIPNEKVKVEYFGESMFADLNKIEKNNHRKVQIIIGRKKEEIQNIFSQFQKPFQKFNFDCNQEIIVKGEEGTIITIPRNTLVDQNNQVVKGIIEVQLKEFYKKSEMIMSDLHTMSGNNLLETGGMICLNLYKEGEELKLKNGEEVKIEMSSQGDNGGMKTFNGQHQPSGINWVEKPSPMGQQVIEFNQDNDLGYQAYGDTVDKQKLAKIDQIILTSSKLGWINCDRFYKVANKTNLIVNVDKSIKPVVRLVFKDINSIMPCFLNMNGEGTFPNVPVGSNAQLIAFGLIDDEPYYVSKEVVIKKDQKEMLVPVKTTFDIMKKELAELD